ncbi:MAG: hypothetical protein M1828_003754 [Chrysothrix sp. TS-e1954]|nr:MAG: hypothetical protein M1828_003754 [Chrysothrix sp. TS-e1954]
MPIQPVIRHQNGLLTRALFLSKRASASPPTSRLPQQCRQAHAVPRLGRHQKTFEEHGVADLYTPEGFEMSWTRQMTHTINRLNDVLAQTPGDLAHSSTKDILLQTARSPSTAHLFNYASMAHNTHFYFSSLSPESTSLPSNLREPISRSFSSLDTLKDTMLTSADAMFGPGFVWLCQINNAPMNHPNNARPSDTVDMPGQANATIGGRRNPVRQAARPLNFRLLTTYLAGSPYPGAHARQQNRDLNTENLQSATEYYKQNTVQNTAGSFGPHASRQMSLVGGDGEDAQEYGGADIVPVLCVNTWEHAWLFDWGIGGKRQFLERWWDRIDWNVVASRIEWLPATPQIFNAGGSRRSGLSF